MGQSPDSKSYNKDKVGMPFYQGNADFGDEHPTPTVWCNAPKKIAKKGDILISVRAPIGDMNIANEECCIGRGLAAIRLNALDLIDKNYLYNYLSTLIPALKEQGTGSTFKAINKGALESIKIYCPSLEKQKEISKLIFEIKTAIKYKTAELSALDDLVKSRFIEMFGDVDTIDSPYEICKLNDVANIGSSHRVFTTEFVEKGVPFYRGTEIGELANGKKPANPYYISKEHYQRLSYDSTKPKIGDLLMPSICSKGQVWMVDTDEPFYYKDGRVLCISPNLSVFNPLYLLHFMRFKTEIEYQKLDTGPTFSEFKIFILKDFDVIIPPMSIQNEFADFVKLIDKSKFIVQKQIEDLQELLDSKMDEYFG